MDDDIALGDEVELLTTSLERTDSPAGNKKPRKPSSHPSPLWKEDNWRLTRKLLDLLLLPAHDILRRALWPRIGETPAGGSKIEYQTEIAKLTLQGWEHEQHVVEDPRWYGNRVKDWMHKLPKIYSECEKEVVEAAAAQDVSVEEWAREGKINTRCPVYHELQLLLGSTIGVASLPRVPSAFELPTNVAKDDEPDQLSSLDPSLRIDPPPVIQAAPMPIAHVLERIAATTSNGTPGPSSERRRKLNDGTSIPVSKDSTGLEWLVDIPKKPKGVKRDRNASDDSSDDSFYSSSDHSPSGSLKLREARKQRKMDLHHERALRRDELKHERALVEIAEQGKAREERAKEREFELEKLRLQLALTRASVAAGAGADNGDVDGIAV